MCNGIIKLKDIESNLNFLVNEMTCLNLHIYPSMGNLFKEACADLSDIKVICKYKLKNILMEAFTDLHNEYLLKEDDRRYLWNMSSNFTKLFWMAEEDNNDNIINNNVKELLKMCKSPMG